MNIYFKILLFSLIQLSINCLAQNEIEFDTLSLKCLESRIRGKEIIIKSQEEYNSLNQFLNDRCEYKPFIDFDEKILIGYNAETTGCLEPTFGAVIRSKSNFYEVELTVYTYGVCRRLFRKVFWAVIDRPPDGVAIDFKINKIYQNSKN